MICLILSTNVSFLINLKLRITKDPNDTIIGGKYIFLDAQEDPNTTASRK